MSRAREVREVREVTKKIYPVDDPSRGGTGTLSVIAIGDDAIRFRHESVLGQERKLTADPIELSGLEWKIFVDRGMAVNATSMVTRAISKLGDFIATVEMDYNLDLNKSLEDRLKLITNENSKSKYKTFIEEQERLAKFYKIECDIDPNNIETAMRFKNAILQELQHFRNITYRTEGASVIPRVHSDDVIFKAMKLVEDFQWPLDPEELSRRRKITNQDQLMAESAERVVFDPRITFGGLNVDQRDQLAHCIAVKLGLKDDERKNFLSEIKKLTPTHGVGLEHFEPLFERSIDDGYTARAGKTILNGAMAGTGVVLNLAVVAGTVATSPLWAIPYAALNAAGTKPQRINTEFDALLKAKASELAAEYGNAGFFESVEVTLPGVYEVEQADGADKMQDGKRVLRRDENGRHIPKKEQINEIAAIEKLKAISPYSESIDKLKALTAFQVLIKVSEDDFDNARNELKRHLSPYHDMAQVTSARKLLEGVASVTGEFKKDPFNLEKQKAVNEALQKLTPKLMAPESEAGPDFVRSSVAGNVYELAGSISNVVEDMARRDPVFGLFALVSMSLGFAYVGVVGAHAGSTAAAASASKFAASIAQTKVYPWLYHGISPLTAKSEIVDKSIITFVNGLTIGKLSYLALSMMRSTVTGQEGFSSEILSIMTRYPTEAVITAAFMYALGGAMIHATHEEAALGTFKMFDEMTMSLKPAMIAYDQFIVPALEMLHKVDSSVSSVVKKNGQERLANLIAQGIYENISEDQRGDLKLIELQEACLKVIVNFESGQASRVKSVDVSSEIKNKFSENHQHKAAIDTALDNMFSGKAKVAAEQGGAPAIDSSQASTLESAELSKLIWENLSNVPKYNPETHRLVNFEKKEVDQEIFLECLAVALNNSDKSQANLREIANTAVNQVVGQFKLIMSMIIRNGVRPLTSYGVIKTPLQFLEKMYPTEARAYSAGSTNPQSTKHLSAKQQYLSGLFEKELLESKRDDAKLWTLVNNDQQFQFVVEKTTGKSLKDLRAQPVPPKSEGMFTKFGRAVGKTILGGAVRLIRLPVAAIWSIFRPAVKLTDPSHEFMRAADSYSGYNDLTALVDGVRGAFNLAGRMIARVSEVVLTATSRVTRTLGAERFPNWLDSVTELAHRKSRQVALEHVAPVTVKRPDNVPWYRYSMNKVELKEPKKGGASGTQVFNHKGFSASLNTVIGTHRTQKSFFQTSSLMSRLSIASQKMPKEITTQKATTLYVLKSLFDWEAKEVNKLMDKSETPADKRDDYMLASLQHLFCQEILACTTKDTVVFNAFTFPEKSPVLAHLAGADFDPAQSDPQVALREEINRLLNANKAMMDVNYKVDKKVNNNIGGGGVVGNGSEVTADDIATDHEQDNKAYSPSAPIPSASSLNSPYNLDAGSSSEFQSDLIKKLITAMNSLPPGTELKSATAVLDILNKMFVTEAAASRVKNPNITNAQLLHELQTKFHNLTQTNSFAVTDESTSKALLEALTNKLTLAQLLTSGGASFFSAARPHGEPNSESNKAVTSDNDRPKPG